ncbi:hypothetical protein [Labrys neptuniae]|uniref:Uncharacterized protein n=1 Tax=Labrys neptuniae TaxID=376174 RepID=A0ABV3PNS2_9HYPH
MIDVAARPGEEIIDADNFFIFFQQALAQMRTEKSGATRHQDAAQSRIPVRPASPMPQFKTFMTKKTIDFWGVVKFDGEPRLPLAGTTLPFCLPDIQAMAQQGYHAR